MVRSEAKRKVVAHLKRKFTVSERKACRTIDFERSVHRYESQKEDDSKTREAIKEVAGKFRRYGYRRITVMVNRKDLHVNHKKVYRLYKEMGLEVRKRKRRKLPSHLRVATPIPELPNQRWSIDFVSDQLLCGRRIKVLTVIDDFSKECPLIHVDKSIGGEKLVELFSKLSATRPLPKTIVCDNGPEFISRSFDAWAYRNGVKLDHIRPGKPVENCFIESFNGKFREECLNERVFKNLQHAKIEIENWRKEYNTVRPHSSIGNKTPMEFLRKFKGKMKESPKLHLV